MWAYPTPEEEFALWRVDVDPGSHRVVPGEASGRIALVTSGSVTAEGASGTLRLSRGQSAFLWADEATVRLAGDGTVFAAGRGKAGLQR